MRKILLALSLLAAMLFTFAGCDDGQTTDSQKSAAVQQAVSQSAFDAVPPHQPREFPARHAINRYLQETESTSEPWYVYALAMTGEPLFYIVSETKPLNICVSITTPDRIYGNSQGGWVVRSAPALDGVYYGGAGCDAYYMFDSVTGGYIELSGRTFTLISSRHPLFLETDLRRLSPGAPAESPQESPPAQ